jgi:neutral ceramidase
MNAFWVIIDPNWNGSPFTSFLLTFYGEVLAVITNFGCHPSVALASSSVSGDFTGEAMAVLENILEDHSLVLCTNGAVVNVDPTREMPYWGPRNDSNALRQGRIYAAQVLETLERVSVREKTDIASVLSAVDLAVREVWIKLVEADQDRMQEEYASSWKISSHLQAINKEKKIHTEVQAFRLGNLTLVVYPGEVLAETALMLKSSFPDQALALITLANDYVGYIPTKKAFLEGGYESGLQLNSRVPPEAEVCLFDTACSVIKQVNLIN